MIKEEKITPVVLQTGFRIFFLGAVVYAVVSMAYWLFFYVIGVNIFVGMPLTVWHGHEMIFGFTMAVIAGFLLTAVINWTGRPTLSGIPLLILFIIWCVSRFLAFMPVSFPLWPLAFCNTIFILYLTVAVIRPIVAVKQWRQSVILSKLLLIFTSAVIFYGALLQSDLAGQRKAIRFAVYMIIGLIFTIGRRILPFFIERGVGYEVTLKNNRMLDMASLNLLIVFALLDIFWPQPIVIIFLCALIVVVHILRLVGWHTKGIWKKPLLWILFIGYMFLIFGFILKAFLILNNKPDDAALHAWTAGGVGIFTVGMMTRVAWGHTGRAISAPPRGVGLIFAAIIACAVVRVFFPLFDELHYILWIGISQVLWMIACAIYLVVYFKVLVSPRPDGKWG